MKILSILHHLLLSAVITVIMAVMYVVVQHYRTMANDPQAQIARDISAKVRQGKSIEHVFQADIIDTGYSLSPFVALYNTAGTAVKSTGYLHGNMAQPSRGVFGEAMKNGEYRITWQPQHNIRVALIVSCINSLPLQFIAMTVVKRSGEKRA